MKARVVLGTTVGIAGVAAGLHFLPESWTSIEDRDPRTIEYILGEGEELQGRFSGDNNAFLSVVSTAKGEVKVIAETSEEPRVIGEVGCLDQETLYVRASIPPKSLGALALGNADPVRVAAICEDFGIWGTEWQAVVQADPIGRIQDTPEFSA